MQSLAPHLSQPLLVSAGPLDLSPANPHPAVLQHLPEVGHVTLIVPAGTMRAAWGYTKYAGLISLGPKAQQAHSTACTQIR